MLRRRPDEAEDVVQEAFIAAYHGLRAVDRPIALRPWLYTIVRNRALDELRRPPRSGAVDDEVALRLVPAADPAERLAKRDELRDLVVHIGRLPERQRLALVLREFSGRTHAQTAHALHTTVPATKSLLTRARANLSREADAA